MVQEQGSREVRPEIRPTSVYHRASKAWDDALSKARGDGISYPRAVKKAQAAYDKVLFDYDKQHRS